MKTKVFIRTTSDKGFNNSTTHWSTHEYDEPVTVQKVKELLDMEHSSYRLDEIRIEIEEEEEER